MVHERRVVSADVVREENRAGRCRSASLCLDRRFVSLAKRDISVFMLKVCV